MSVFKLLVVEDDEQDLNTCIDTVERYKEQNQREIELVTCRNITEAIQSLDNSFDGAIIDLRLGAVGDEGNQVIKTINENQYRIPIAILTGTPNSADRNFQYIGVFRKGDQGAGYDDLLNRFWRIHETGLTRIFGGRGTIETHLSKVFWDNLLPQIEKWEEYGETDSKRTENALLRHTLHHLIQLIDEDTEKCFPEEFYLHPPLTEQIRTGVIVQEKDNDTWYVVMSPDCDLVVRKNKEIRNTDRILLVEVVPATKYFDWYDRATIANQSESKKRKLTRELKNNKFYLHCLPETDIFTLGFLNFRHLFSVNEDEFKTRFKTPPEIQISPPFVKDIVARFASYYARQGQPDIDFDKFIGA